MAEIIENTNSHHNYASNGKANAALTLGIIGTALSALELGGGILPGLFGGGYNTGRSAGITNEELYLERMSYQNQMDATKTFYNGQQVMNEKIVNAFFDSYKRDVDNSFNLYKSQRDSDDILSKRIDEVDKKVDIMAAIRPYQDALIDKKIDNTALMAQYNLDKRTCRMITGQLVLPSTPTITGYGSYYPWCIQNTPDTTPAA